MWHKITFGRCHDDVMCCVIRIQVSVCETSMLAHAHMSALSIPYESLIDHKPKAFGRFAKVDNPGTTYYIAPEVSQVHAVCIQCACNPAILQLLQYIRGMIQQICVSCVSTMDQPSSSLLSTNSYITTVPQTHTQVCAVW